MFIKNLWIAILTFTAIVVTPVLAQEQWTETNNPTGNGLEALNKDTVFIVGAGGMIYRTLNGWTSHDTAISGVTRNLFDVRFRNAANGFVVGDSGTILKTANGGASWAAKPSGTIRKLRGVAYPGASIGFAVGDEGTILKTTNAGETWTAQVSGVIYDLYAIQMLDTSLGWAVGHGSVSMGTGPAVLKTTNGGATWVSQFVPNSSRCETIQMLNANVGYISAWEGVFKTVDGGTNWNYIPIANGFGIVAIYYRDTTNAFMGGYNFPVIRKTSDAWQTSDVSHTSPDAWRGGFRTIKFPGQYTGYALGPNIFAKYSYLPPAMPTLSTPAQDAQNTAVALNLSWSIVPHTVTYHVQVSTDSLFSTTVVNDSSILSATTYAENLAYGTTHYWRVRAKNPGGTSGWSSVRRFTTLPPPIPSTPDLIAPSAGAINISPSTTLIWNRVAHAAIYRIQVSTDSLFGSTVVNDSTVADTSRAVTDLLADTKYFWRVNAKNISGTSSYSSVRSFVTWKLAALRNPQLAFSGNGLGGNSLRFHLPHAAHVRVRLYDSKGARVAEVVNESKNAGSYDISLTGVGSAGLYVLEFQAGNYRQVLKLVR
jgi:photosystem II stability/assembly factor-like uncharacterized protein